MSARDGERRGPRRDAKGRERGAVRRYDERSTLAPSARRKGSDAAREVALEVLREVADADAYANLVLPPALRRARLDGRDAAFATELAYGTLRLQGRYDAILTRCTDRALTDVDPVVRDLLRLGAHQLLGMRVATHAAVSETVGLARVHAGTGPSRFVNAVLRRVSERSSQEWEEILASEAPDDDSRLAVLGSHPAWVVRALREALTAHGRDATEIEALLEANNAAARVTLVARPGLLDVTGLSEEVADELGDREARIVPARYAPTAAILQGGDPASIPAVRAGAAAVQDEGSQLVALALAAAPLDGRDERWLDLCAGPGGKAGLLASLAGERGARLLANEAQPHRARLVEQALRAVPADAVEGVVVGDGRTILERTEGGFDRVMVDAPCTGLGALRRRPESRWRREPSDVPALARLQRELLGAALDATRPGGLVAYVTCSPHLAETRLVVDDVLAGRSDVERADAASALRSVALKEPELVPGTDVQLWPHVHGTDAMHLTLLRRTR
ncbi:rRNA small subunit methyltransferase B [Flavimobilis sp. GY10621]|uniref:rRNA small subunit methyltransferase B n=1 Tax=Flavimobilis rhizosphaerae TaxID=2775421 RepID=A0ABR9DTR5_9MICO|nr:transcription antitermination factor NusB [Flavimobilis rhizosphaerae]MBD9700408.1 rRNA small subunit methyltransferase B [Flavimobilis rhizosphaerae]